MQRLLAIAGLTWKAAFRFRLFLVLAVVLIASVVGLPILIKDDGTAQGFTQILLTYTLSVITGLLGLCTLWLSCGTLARDIEECQIQVVATKPIARWQIWLGKWVGILSLNAALLALSGASVYALLQWRATKLPPEEQAKLRNEVLVARGSKKEKSFATEIDAEAGRQLKAALKKNTDPNLDLREVKHQIRERITAEIQTVPPGSVRPWRIDLGLAKNWLRDQPMYLRVKFNTASGSTIGTYSAAWQVGVPETERFWQSEVMSLAPDTFHEFSIPANLFDDHGVLQILLFNPNQETLVFSLDDGMEVLYREGSFTLNYIRGLGIIFCWMALLATLGLAAASFLSFPVAAFFSLAVLTICLSSSTVANVVSEGTVVGLSHEDGSGRSPVDAVALPTFRALLAVINVVKDFSPIDALSTGRSIPWLTLGRAFVQIVLLMGGLIALSGIFVFNRRELAAVQTTQ